MLAPLSCVVRPMCCGRPESTPASAAPSCLQALDQQGATASTSLHWPEEVQGGTGSINRQAASPQDGTAVPACRLPNGSGAMGPHQAQLAAQQQQMAALLQQQFMQLGLPPPTPQQQLEFWQTTQAQQHQAQADQRQQQSAPSATGESPARWTGGVRLAACQAPCLHQEVTLCGKSVGQQAQNATQFAQVAPPCRDRDTALLGQLPAEVIQQRPPAAAAEWARRRCPPSTPLLLMTSWMLLKPLHSTPGRTVCLPCSLLLVAYACSRLPTCCAACSLPDAIPPLLVPPPPPRHVLLLLQEGMGTSTSTTPTSTSTTSLSPPRPPTCTSRTTRSPCPLST